MACQKKTTNYPEEMPSDFGLSLNFGYYGKEEVNFYNNTITKDLIEGGLSTINFNPDDKILKDIYKKLKDQNIAGIKGNLKNNNKDILPPRKYILTFTLNGENYTILGDDTMNFDSKESKDFIEFVNYIIDYVMNTEEYKSLPDATGGYD